MSNRREVVVFGGGCFWCTETVFKMLRGVYFVLLGYAGGRVVKSKYPIGNMGFYAQVADTEGNVIGLWEYVKNS